MVGAGAEALGAGRMSGRTGRRTGVITVGSGSLNAGALGASGVGRGCVGVRCSAIGVMAGGGGSFRGVSVGGGVMGGAGLIGAGRIGRSMIRSRRVWVCRRVSTRSGASNRPRCGAGMGVAGGDGGRVCAGVGGFDCGNERGSGGVVNSARGRLGRGMGLAGGGAVRSSPLDHAGVGSTGAGIGSKPCSYRETGRGCRLVSGWRLRVTRWFRKSVTGSPFAGTWPVAKG